MTSLKIRHVGGGAGGLQAPTFLLMYDSKHSIQMESRSPFSVSKFTHLQEVPVAESPGPVGGKYPNRP